MPSTNPFPSNLSEQQIIQQAYDESEQRLRVDAIVTATIADVIIHASESSIAIGDQNTGNLMTVNADGSINADIVLASTTDNIAIGNQAGTNFLAVNADGSINTELEGLNSFQTSQYTISLSAVQITPSPLANRSAISFKALCATNQMIFIGNSNSVTSTTGYPLFDGDSLQMDLTPAHQVWAIASAAGQTLAVLELG
jgi:hypothetical protein